MFFQDLRKITLILRIVKILDICFYLPNSDSVCDLLVCLLAKSLTAKKYCEQILWDFFFNEIRIYKVYVVRTRYVCIITVPGRSGKESTCLIWCNKILMTLPWMAMTQKDLFRREKDFRKTTTSYFLCVRKLWC